MTLQRDIASWDGKSADDIAQIYDRYAQRPDLLAELVKHANKPDLQSGATWLIKRHIENTAPLNARETKQLLELLPDLEGWEARLHLLQCLPHLAIPSPCKAAVELFTRESITDDNKFVRAWGYGGFYELARQFPDLQDEATQLIEMAKRDEPASVQARIRRVTAKGF
ncbi:MAG: hypothetical protein QNJ73_04235 [Gammaproteobacteria bacterium]|nr:hypothetical protein [Gammaproteobacteria bacterium]